MKSPKMDQLLRVYEDLEGVLKHLKKEGERRSQFGSHHSIDIRKLVDQLSRSKKKLERKIGNKLLLEKQTIKRRLRLITSEWRKSS